MIQEKAIALLQEIFEKSHVDESHGMQHALDVLDHARSMLRYEDTSPNEMLSVELAALLHDLDDRKYFPTNKNFENARFVLETLLPQKSDLHRQIIDMIMLVSTSHNGNSTAGIEKFWMLIPRFADRLEAIGEVGVERCLAYTLHRRRPLFTPTTPRVTTEEGLWKIATNERFAAYLVRKESDSFIDHFYDKLLHIGTQDALGHPKNPYLVEQAQVRHQYMIDYVLTYFSTLKTEVL